MKTLRFSLLLMLFTALLGVGARGQKTPSKRTTTRTSPSKTTPVRAASTVPPLDVRAARVKVSNQVSNVSRFIDVMGPIAQSIEALDAEARTRKVSQASLDTNQKNKQGLLTAIKNMRAGIDSLETEFETKPALRIYLSRLQGISDLAAQSENLAFTGKFLASRDPWRTILQRLTDTMNSMPNAEL